MVGAGAGVGLEMPTGIQLTEKIIAELRFENSDIEGISGSKVNLENSILSYARKASLDPTALFNAAKFVTEALPGAPSIDNFIHTHQNDVNVVLLGKLGIVLSILAAEGACIFSPMKLRTTASTFQWACGTWLGGFFKALVEGVDQQTAAKSFKNVSIVNFNYDRCIETFLHIAFQVYFRLDPYAAVEMRKAIQIVHPYGRVDAMPDYWEKAKTLNFGQLSVAKAKGIDEVVSSIRTFTETNTEIPAVTSARSLLHEADTVVFLGFAFHPINIELLSDPASSVFPFSSRKTSRIFGTGIGLSPSDIDIVTHALSENMLAILSPQDVIIDGKVDCRAFFENYRRTLTSR